MQCAFVNPGDSFIFPKGTYHSWLNAYVSDDYNTYYDTTDSPTSAPTASPGPSPAESTSANGGSGGGTGDVNVASEQLVTVTTFLDAAPPDASLLMVSPTGPDSDGTLDDAVPGGVVGSLVVDGGGSLVNGFGPTAPLVSVTIGNFDLGNVEGPLPNSGSPLFPQITGPSDYGEPGACKAAQNKADDFTNESDDGMGLRSPVALFETDEVETGVFATGCDGPCGGAVRLVSGAAWPLREWYVARHDELLGNSPPIPRCIDSVLNRKAHWMETVRGFRALSWSDFCSKLRKDLGKYSPYIEDLRLADFKVRILTSGTEAVTRVMIESADAKGNRWFTVGVSPNIVDASFQALTDSITHKLLRDGAPAPKTHNRKEGVGA